MDSLVINGGNPLSGSVKISGAKNAALPILAATLLTDHQIILSNVPKLTDIYTIKELLKSLGSNIEVLQDLQTSGYILDVNCDSINNLTADYEIVRKMRASIWVLAPLLAKFGEAMVSLPGGCTIGARQVDLHIKVLESMGAEICLENGYIHAKSKGRLKATNFTFEKVSVGASITAIMAASLADGETVLSSCAMEPEIIDLCNFLQQIGAQIQGIGTSTLTIIGQESLGKTNYMIMPDRIEAGTYMVAAAISKGELDILGIDYNLVKNIAEKLSEAGILVEQKINGLKVKYIDKILPVNIDTAPYPGFATDLQAQIMSLMAIASGDSVITENIFENRFMHVPELCRMGADIKVDGHHARIKGVKSLKGAEVMASDLRASVSLILAGLAAEGRTKVRRIYHLDRGYQDLVAKLTACGAEVERIHGDHV
jgi:UDP-N-acetylglucosamine 1-carboxyvinyltransferase